MKKRNVKRTVRKGSPLWWVLKGIAAAEKAAVLLWDAVGDVVSVVVGIIGLLVFLYAVWIVFM